jgi:hypothetical protein
MVYLRTGKLPWLRKLEPGLTKMQRYEAIKKMKIAEKISNITKGLPT